jgi:hypothetical protein
MARTLVYLAVPYSDPDPAVREWRFEKVNAAAAVLMRAGLHIFSPISHTHPIAKAGELPLGWDFWEGYDRAILQTCAALLVFMLPGWSNSSGVYGEAKIAGEINLPVFHVGEDNCTASFAHELLEKLKRIDGGTR